MPQTDTKRKPRKAKKNQSLELLRAVTKSMAGAIPGISDDTRDAVEDSLARVTSGFASQAMGVDEDGNLQGPFSNIQRSWNADARRKAGLPRKKQVMPGIIQDTLSLPQMGGMIGLPVPQFANDAGDQASLIHEGVNEGMGLDAPEGFRENAMDSLGVMAGQLPIPGKGKIEAAKDVGQGALSLFKKYGKKALTSPVEFFSPTVEPKLANYAAGAGFGGALGAAGDNPEPIMRLLQAMGDQPIPEDPRIQRPRQRLPDLDLEDLPELTQRAKGGKVGALKQFLKAVNMNPDSTTLKRVPYQIGDPVEEVLYAINEGQRKGVLSSPEAKRIKLLMEAGDDESLSEALLDLHQRLQPKSPPPAPGGPPPLPTAPQPGELGHGKMTQEEFDRLVLKRGQ